ncbi:Calmodulin, partial [Durusdinium trenchii]
VEEDSAERAAKRAKIDKEASKWRMVDEASQDTLEPNFDHVAGSDNPANTPFESASEPNSSFCASLTTPRKPRSAAHPNKVTLVNLDSVKTNSRVSILCAILDITWFSERHLELLVAGKAKNFVVIKLVGRASVWAKANHVKVGHVLLLTEVLFRESEGTATLAGHVAAGKGFAFLVHDGSRYHTDGLPLKDSWKQAVLLDAEKLVAELGSKFKAVRKASRTTTTARSTPHHLPATDLSWVLSVENWQRNGHVVSVQGRITSLVESSTRQARRRSITISLEDSKGAIGDLRLWNDWTTPESLDTLRRFQRASAVVVFTRVRVALDFRLDRLCLHGTSFTQISEKVSPSSPHPALQVDARFSSVSRLLESPSTGKPATVQTRAFLLDWKGMGKPFPVCKTCHASAEVRERFEVVCPKKCGTSPEKVDFLREFGPERPSGKEHSEPGHVVRQATTYFRHRAHCRDSQSFSWAFPASTLVIGDMPRQVYLDRVARATCSGAPKDPLRGTLEVCVPDAAALAELALGLPPLALLSDAVASDLREVLLSHPGRRSARPLWTLSFSRLVDENGFDQVDGLDAALLRMDLHVTNTATGHTPLSWSRRMVGPGLLSRGVGPAAVGAVATATRGGRARGAKADAETSTGDGARMAMVEVDCAKPAAVRDAFFFEKPDLQRASQLQAEESEVMQAEDAAAKVEMHVESIRTAPLSHPLNAGTWHGTSESPNSLARLLGPTVHFACGFVKRKAPRKRTRAQLTPWRGEVRVASETPPPPLARLERRRKPAKVAGNQQEKSHHQQNQLPISKNSAFLAKQLEASHESFSGDSSLEPPKKTGVMEELARILELALAKDILARESLLKRLYEMLHADRPVPVSVLQQYLKQVQQCGLRVVETLVRLYRSLRHPAPLATTSIGSGSVAASKTSKRRSDRRRNNQQCALAHTHTFCHGHEAYNYRWKGDNYLLKMAQDTNFLDRLLSEETKASVRPLEFSFRRNPLLLRLNLERLNEQLLSGSLGAGNSTIHCPEMQLWKLLEQPEREEVRLYQAALVIAREELHFGALPNRQQKRLQLQALDIDRAFPVPDRAMVLHECIAEEEGLARSTKGCWKSSDKIPARVPIGPFQRKRANKTFIARVQALEALYTKGSLARLCRERTAAAKLQCFMRRFLAVARDSRLQRQQVASIVLQAMWRRQLAVQRVTKLRLAANDQRAIQPVLDWFQVAENAAVAVQCARRSVVACRRTIARRQYRAATRLASWYRFVTKRHEFLMFTVARKVQAAVRGRIAQNRSKLLRLQKQERAGAIALQTVYRRVHARHVVDELKRSNAATAMQSKVRGFLSKSLLQKILCARKVQSQWRRKLAQRKAQRCRDLQAAVRKVQHWHQIKLLLRSNALQEKLLAWRAQHSSFGRKFAGEGRDVSFFHMCGLYDHRQRLTRRLQLLERTRTAKLALARLNKLLVAERQKRGIRAVERAPVLAMMRVKQRYQHLLHLTKHLTGAELENETAAVARELGDVNDKIAIVEDLVKAHFRAESLAIRSAQVSNMDECINVADPRNLGMFQEKYEKTRQRENAIKARQEEAVRAKERWQTALRLAEWNHRARVQHFIENGAKTKQQIRKREALGGAKAVVGFLRGKGLARAASRRAEAKKDAIIAKRLHARIAGMTAEDQYATRHRAFLTAEKAAVDHAHSKFARFDKHTAHPGEITLLDFQHLAFDLGVTVPISRVKRFVAAVDQNGNGLIDFDEFAIW